MPGVNIVRYQPGKSSTKGIHKWAADFEAKVIRGSVAYKAAKKVRDDYGFTPDVIVAHPGWGESLFLKEAWPEAKLVLFCEWYYGKTGDYVFDPEFQTDREDGSCRIHAKNAHNLLSMDRADLGLAPTQWQKSTYPEWFKPKIEVIHDGIDTPLLKPVAHKDPLVLRVPEDKACGIGGSEVSLSPGEEIVTFVNRNLEPYRGYHIFMRMLPELLRRRPNLKVVIVGGNEHSYGTPPGDGRSWKQLFLDEVRADLDLSRVYFVGKIPYPSFVKLLQMTTVHTYHTYPFVLSWSLMEAMSCGCAIVAGDSPPLREVMQDKENGRLVDFFDINAQVEVICELLDDPAERKRLGRKAREVIVSKYDMQSICLPKQVNLITGLMKS